MAIPLCPPHRTVVRPDKITTVASYREIPCGGHCAQGSNESFSVYLSTILPKGIITDEEMKVQKTWVACLRSHFW